MPFTEVRGNKVYHESKGSGEPVLLLNGAMANTASWGFQVPAFVAGGYRVVLMDFVGQGQSSKQRTRYTMRQHVDEVTAVLDAEGISSANVVGVSYGGEVAMLCGIEAPERVKSLVVSNSVGRVDRAMRGRTERWLLASRFRSGRILWQCVYPDIYSAQFLEKNWDFVAKTAPAFDLIDFDAFGEILKAFMELDVMDRLDRITAPTLILASDEDGTKPPQYSEELHKGIRGSKLQVIAGAGHVLNWEKPKEFNDAVLEFLGEVRR
jgi:3-oxoadipate enol-lactonase